MLSLKLFTDFKVPARDNGALLLHRGPSEKRFHLHQRRVIPHHSTQNHTLEAPRDLQTPSC